MYVFFLRMYVGLEIDQEVGVGLKYIHKVPKTEYFGPNKAKRGLSQFFKKHVLFFLRMYIFFFQECLYFLLRMFIFFLRMYMSL